MLGSYSRGFWLMCLSSFLFFLSFNLLLPELPDHLAALGGGEYKGLIIALFTLTAAISRPVSGKLTDTVGRSPVMVFGSLVCFVCGFFYPWALTVSSFLLLRLLHGFSTGFKPTGTAAFVADIVPAHKRGEAMGVLGMSGSLGMAIGPWLGSQVAERASLNAMFYCSAAMALVSVLVQGTLTETLPQIQRRKFSFSLLKIDMRREVLEPRVMAPAITTLLCLLPYGAVLTVIPDQSQLLGLPSKSTFFTYYIIASLSMRLLTGKASDRHGRVPVLRWSAAILAVGLAVLVWAPSVPMFLLGAVIFGVGTGLNSPTLYAWTVDLSHPERRGRGLATMYIALEVGIGLGALLAGWVFNNQAARLPWVHALSLGSVLLALAYLWLGVRATPPGPAENDALVAEAMAVAAPEEIV